MSKALPEKGIGGSSQILSLTAVSSLDRIISLIVIRNLAVLIPLLIRDSSTAS